MKKTNITWIILLCLIPFVGNAQRLHTLNKDLPCLDRDFQLMIHIVVDSTRELGVTQEAIQANINEMNNLFEPICVSFGICEIDTIMDYNFGDLPTRIETSDLMVNFAKDRRFDVFIVDELLGPGPCGLGGSGRIWLEKGCLSGFTHEMGHAWGLAHTFEGNGEELVDGSNCETAGDGICDTPADPYDPDDESTKWQIDCEFIYEGKDANGDYYQPDMGNIMSYYKCSCGFTRGQYLRMAGNIQNSELW